MARKELSPYAPDVWIRQLNRTYPNLWTDLRKVYAEPEKILNSKSGGVSLIKNVPDWCIMPTLFPFLLITNRYGEPYYLTHMDEMMTIGSMYVWRASKGIYRFAPEIYEALISQPLTGNLPTDCLYHLPEWAVYIETPGLSYERHPMKGFIAHLDYNLFSRNVDLQFAMFLEGCDQPKMVALPFGEGSLLDAMNRVDQVDDLFMGKRDNRYIGSRDEYRQTFSSMLQLLLYLCSDEPDMPEIEHPQKRRRLSGGFRSPEAPRVWDVGVRISTAIRNYRAGEVKRPWVEAEGEGHGHASPRPHVRSAHWHTYWTGPREAVFPEKKPVMRWIPPLPIGMNGRRELPTNIRMVE